MKRELSEKLDQKNFKMEIINELIHLSSQDRSRKIDEIIQKEFKIPYSKKKYISRATIYLWLKQHKEDTTNGWALVRKKRKDSDVFRKLTLLQKKCILRWRHENPRRTCQEIRDELMSNGVVSVEHTPSVSVIARYLKGLCMDRHSLAKKTPKSKIRTPFQADYPNQIWQIDTKGYDLQISSKGNAKTLEDVMPIVIVDDFSRYVVGVRYIYKKEEDESMVMMVLMEAIEKYGVPEVLYTDRGGPYMGKALKKALNILGCRVIPTSARDPAAKGKVEKLMPMYTEKLDLELKVKGQQERSDIQTVNEYAKGVTNHYHNTVHSATKQKPIERYLGHTGKFRRFVSIELLTLVFLPLHKSKVTKDNLIQLNKRKYIIPLIGYAGKFVDVRSLPLNLEIIYVWAGDEFLGVAEEFSIHNDYLKKHQYITHEVATSDVEIPMKDDVPEFQRLDRKLQDYRAYQENKEYINQEILRLQKQRADVKAELTLSNSSNSKESLDVQPKECTKEVSDEVSSEFTGDKCIHLFSTLFRRVLSAAERFAIHRIFLQYGPFEEKMVRSVIGRLLGESHPTSDLEGYLDALRIESTKKRSGV